MSGRIIAYLRVSAGDLDETVQLDGIKNAGVTPDEVYVDHAHSDSRDRPSLEHLLSSAGPGDTVVAYSLARLARNLSDLDRLIRDFAVRGCGIWTIKEQLVFGDNAAESGILMRQALTILADFERELRQERSEEAKAGGRAGGRPRRLSPEEEAQFIAEATQPGANKAALARKWGLHKVTCYRLLRRCRQENGQAAPIPGGMEPPAAAIKHPRRI